MEKPVSAAALYEHLLDCSLDVICSIDKEGRFCYVSSASQYVWGYTPKELVGKKYIDLVLPEDHSKTQFIAEAVMAGEIVTSFENRYIKKQGYIVPVLWSAKWSTDEQIMYCVAKDATQIKEADKQKKLQEGRLQRAYRLAGLAWWELDIATETYTSSDEIFQMYGLPIPPDNKTTLEEFLSYVHPDDVARLSEDLSTLCKDSYINYEHRIVKPTGEVIHVMHYSELIRDEQGNPIALHGTTKDVTEDRRKEKALYESYLRYELVNKATSDAIWDWDIEQDIVRWGKGFHTKFGHDTANMELNSAAVAAYIHPNDAERVVTGIRKAINSSATNWEDEFQVRRADNTYADVVDKGFIIRSEKGKALRMVGALQDISKQKQAERAATLSEQKLNKQKLVAHQQMTKIMLEAQEKERSLIGCELHDNVCQLLTTAKLYIENTKHFPERWEEFAKKAVDLLLLSLNEIRFLSKQLVTPVIQEAEFEETLHELTQHYRALHLFEINLQYEAQDVRMCKDLQLAIYRILQEQFNNTVKYSKASAVDIAILKFGNTLKMQYADNGVGFDSTSSKNGIGLKNMQHRAEAFRGKVSITSAIGKGCQVEIIFPLDKREELDT